MSDQDREMSDHYLAVAQQTFDAIQAEIKELAEANKSLLEENAASYRFVGTTTFATAFIWGTIVTDATYVDSGKKVKFDGSHWGVGLGGGISVGVGTFTVPPAELAGGASYQITTTPVVVNIHWWRGKQYLGVFVGAPLAVGAMAVGGSGTWKLVA